MNPKITEIVMGIVRAMTNNFYNPGFRRLVIIALLYTIGLCSGSGFAIEQPNSAEAPEIIGPIVMAKSINEKTGDPIDITSEFAENDKDIILVVALSGCKIGTRIEYVRYLNNKFLDHGSIKLRKAQSETVSFIWSLRKKNSSHLKGNYRIKTYLNGKFGKDIFYTVK